MPETDRLLSKYPIISDQIDKVRLKIVLREAERIIKSNVEGNFVELGCYIGTTSLFLRRLLNCYDQSSVRELYVYDSFEGLPLKSSEDVSTAGDQFKKGELRATKKSLVTEFKKGSLQVPVIHKAWFSDLSYKDIPKPIAFAFLDGDFYDSILESLQLVWGNMADDSVIAVDDYGSESLPGVEKAVRAFLKSKSYKRLHNEHHIGIIEL